MVYTASEQHAFLWNPLMSEP